MILIFTLLGQISSSPFPGVTSIHVCVNQFFVIDIYDLPKFDMKQEIGNQSYATIWVDYIKVCTQGTLQYARTEASMALIVIVCLFPYVTSFIRPLLFA